VIRLRLLGPIELLGSDGRELRAVLAQPRRLALLAYLAAGGGFHRRDVLLALFWPEHDDAHARDALNAALSFLRRTLGSGTVMTRGVEEVGLAATRLWCDVPAFRTHVANGRNEEALELYRADLLHGFHADRADGFADWAERERAALRSSAAKAARALAKEREGDAQFTTAVASARRAVELSDADERVVRELLALLDRLGDRAGALHAYDQFARRLAAEYNAVPSAETRALVEHLRARGAVAALAAAPPALSPTDHALPSNARGWNVERELGRGGMAVVYLARDVKHDRLVALKVMRPEVASALGAERFLREIRIMARLAHPHILPLIDSGGREGALYLVTPYVAGESLRDRLRREKRLPLEDALRITRDVAAALDYAHRAGVVHRDIKPENVLLQDGQALVADFGIALALRAAGDGQVMTTIASSLGTPGYMSPEQVQGDDQVDGRADVYAMGAVLYEMLTGGPPHAGPDTDAVVTPLPTAPVAPVRSCRGDVPRHVDAAVLRALARRPGDRFASAAAFAHALDPPAVAGRGRAALGARLGLGVAVAAVVIAAGWNTWRFRARAYDASAVVVLPFSVRAADSSLNYLREGAVDVFGARLTGDGVPRAIDARTVLAAYRRAAGPRGEISTPDARALARNLGAGLLLTGEIVASRDRTVMSARLVDVESGRYVAEHTESGTDDALSLTTRLATRLLAKSVGESPTRLSAISDSVEAVRAYLAGLRTLRSGRPRDAFDQLSRALEIDPTFASAALWRAYTAWGAFTFGNAPKRMADSVAWALRGRLTPRDSLILAALPSIGPNYPAPSTALEVVQAWERAARANPDRADVWAEWAKTLYAFGDQAGISSHLSTAAMAAERAVTLDPAYARGYNDRSYIALRQRDTAAMRRWERRWYALDSVGNVSHHWAIARALGDSARAESLFTRLATRWREAQQPGAWRLNIELWSAGDGLASTAEAESLTRLQLAGPDLTPDQRRDLAFALFRLGALRGRLRWTTSYADSIPGLAALSINLALSEPEYAPLADRAVDSLTRRLPAMREPEQRANAICHRELWRVHTGDTTGARGAAAQMRRLVAPLGPAPGWRVGNLGICPLLLEAWLDRRPGQRWTSPALDRLEPLLLGGIITELPHNLTYLMAARWRAEQGDTVRALRLLRRFDPMAYQVTEPARWRLEGHLAAAVGDTAGAVRAYRRFLEIRDQPDPGPMEAGVREVRAALAALDRP
jgi:serine/threonine-protein kinase